VIVSRDRPAGARLCAAQGASVIVMDDGLQNPSLVKDLALAVVDGASGIGNGACLPAGPLRAPLAAQWAHVHAVVVVGDGAPGEAIAAHARRRGTPVLRARLEADAATAARLRGRRVLAFAGIGRPQKFFATLDACGANVVRTRSFPDHHPFAAAEIGALVAEAAAEHLALVTTEKDLVRITDLGDAASGGDRIQSLPVRRRQARHTPPAVRRSSISADRAGSALRSRRSAHKPRVSRRECSSRDTGSPLRRHLRTCSSASFQGHRRFLSN
jgi:tetraacyldisaccharide 4'-kinase